MDWGILVSTTRGTISGGRDEPPILFLFHYHSLILLLILDVMMMGGILMNRPVHEISMSVKDFEVEVCGEMEMEMVMVMAEEGCGQ